MFGESPPTFVIRLYILIKVMLTFQKKIEDYIIKITMGLMNLSKKRI